MSNSSDEEKQDEPEIELHYTDIENKSSEEVLKYLKEKLNIEEGEDHLLKEAIESGSSKTRKIKWVWGQLPKKS